MTSSNKLVRSLAIAGLSMFPFVATAAVKPKQPANPWSFGLRAEGQVKYDDNVLSLSERDKDRVDPSDPNNANRFGIESPDDFIFSPEVSLQLARSPRRGRETNIDLTLRALDYRRDSVKDYQEYALALRQELNRSRAHRTVLTVGGSTIPKYFLRRLTDDDESQAAGRLIRHAADYRLTRGYVEISQEIVDRTLKVTGGYARERRNYNEHFNERDSDSDVYTLEVDVFPLRRNALRIRPYYERESRNARGDIASTVGVIDDDVGYDSDRYGLELRGLWGPGADHRRLLKGYYEKEARDFTTDFTPDVGHFGREDDITKYGIGYDQEFGPRWRASFWAYHRVNDVSSPTSPTTSFTKRVVSAALVYSFDHRFDQRRKEESP